MLELNVEMLGVAGSGWETFTPEMDLKRCQYTCTHLKEVMDETES